MPLKVRSIANDASATFAVINFVDILDERPLLSATINMSTTEHQTQAEIGSGISLPVVRRDLCPTSRF